MKRIYFLVSTIILILTFCSCSKSKSVKNAEIEAAAIRDCERVTATEPNSMQREKAILEIKVRESSLRLNGYDEEADQYISIARRILVDSLHIISEK